MYFLMWQASDADSIRDEDAFTDVELEAEDGFKIRAHKIILASHSDFFYR